VKWRAKPDILLPWALGTILPSDHPKRSSTHFRNMQIYTLRLGKEFALAVPLVAF
jgi:hypothetical protein